jgi:Heterokaryon incompatibility protein Het-C
MEPAHKAAFVLLAVIAGFGPRPGGAQAPTGGYDAKRVAPEYPGFAQIQSQARRAANVGSGPKFATEIHVGLVEKTPVALQCTEVDILLAFDPTAHFDNCQFAATADYVRSLFDKARSAASQNQRDESLAALGRALHAIQDFYSHTNYVELAADKYAELSDVPIQSVWTAEGKVALLKAVDAGLVSGTVAWEPRNACKAPMFSHADLNKDTPGSRSGKELVATWGRSRHQAARELAVRATFEFLRQAFALPELAPIAQQCTGQLGVLLLIDNRDHE